VEINLFYGNPEVVKRRESWALMRHLSTFTPTPWLCVGDFNEIINFSEQRGQYQKQGDKWRIFREPWKIAA
jgi:hypothetical protein